MDPLSQLPVECLERILLYAISTYGSKFIIALASLLRLNRHIFIATIPFCTNTPSCPSMITPLAKQDFNGREPLSALFPLRAILIQFWPAELGFDTIPMDFNPTRFNYLGQVRRLDLVQFVVIEYDIYGLRKELEDYSEDKDAYIYGEELRGIEAIWSLATTILGLLESLTFPLSDVHRYIQIVDQLGRLERASVVLDIPFRWICCGEQESEATRFHKEKVVRDVVQFVEDHRRIFPSRLKAFSTSPNIF
ncbi:MAG: hypothetical protein J3R72DRAFT_496727 [Linnemannia gamsii]|nr:MAG: hypothetical protein J3R72DRAFT_496727 [Linnemannia gamsii]